MFTPAMFVMQTLTDEFRGHYSQMWLSMINADIVGMKRHAEAMNVGHLYGLFACILTARSWTALRSGISRHQFSEAEVGIIDIGHVTAFV